MYPDIVVNLVSEYFGELFEPQIIELLCKYESILNNLQTLLQRIVGINGNYGAVQSLVDFLTSNLEQVVLKISSLFKGTVEHAEFMEYMT